MISCLGRIGRFMKHVYTFPVFCILSRAVLSSCMLSVIAIPSYADQQLAAEEPRFTVNFNDTSVIEVIRFVSKITGANFVFSEEDQIGRASCRERV